MGKRYSEVRVMGILREAASGVPVMDVCWNHSISRATLRTWQAKHFAAPSLLGHATHCLRERALAQQ